METAYPKIENFAQTTLKFYLLLCYPDMQNNLAVYMTSSLMRTVQLKVENLAQATLKFSSSGFHASRVDKTVF